MHHHDFIPNREIPNGDAPSSHPAIAELEPWLVDVVTAHPSSLDLVEYALGLEPGAMDGRRPLDRALLERHLADCPACRREVAMVTAEDTVVDVDFGGDVGSTASAPAVAAPTRPSRAHGPGTRFLATAAGLVLAVATGAWLGSQLDDTLTEPSVAALVEPAPLVGAPDPAPEATTTPSTGLFFDGFETGDTGTWSDVSVQ